MTMKEATNTREQRNQKTLNEAIDLLSALPWADATRIADCVALWYSKAGHVALAEVKGEGR